MKYDDLIFVAGHNGMVGSSVCRQLAALGYNNIVTMPSRTLDLRDQRSVDYWFDNTRPDYVFMCAAKVGGILANNRDRGQFIHENLLMQDNVIDSSHRWRVKKLLFLGSSCIYPRDCRQPIKEEYLMTGPLEETNKPYAIAKIAGIETCAAYKAQYGLNYVAAMPTNLYGYGDNYSRANSHVIPALIRKFHEAKHRDQGSVLLCGTGRALREFLFVNDLASALVRLVKNDYGFDLVNIGSGQEVSIKELATIIADVVGFKGVIVWDNAGPDGTPRKLLDSGRMMSTGWRPVVDLYTGLQRAYYDFQHSERL